MGKQNRMCIMASWHLLLSFSIWMTSVVSDALCDFVYHEKTLFKSANPLKPMNGIWWNFHIFFFTWCLMHTSYFVFFSFPSEWHRFSWCQIWTLSFFNQGNPLLICNPSQTSSNYWFHRLVWWIDDWFETDQWRCTIIVAQISSATAFLFYCSKRFIRSISTMLKKNIWFDNIRNAQWRIKPPPYPYCN